jgi:UDP-N-acetylglucosamine:LPS N-acetylglucosamine transferase
MASDWQGGPGRPTVTIVSASVGAGHDGAAAELARRLVAAGFGVRRHDFLDMLPEGWGGAARGAYERQLRHAPASWGWLLRATAGPRATAGACALVAGAATSRMRAAIGPGATAVVSTYPLASQVLGRLRRDGRLTAPVIAFMTDPSVHRLCVAPGVDLHIAPNERAAADIRKLRGGPTMVAAPVVGPAFRPSGGLSDAYEARYRLGLPLIDRLAVVVAGSWGVGDIESTAYDIAATGSAVPVVACGRNDVLRRRLAGSGQIITLGWVDDMPSLLRAGDVVVHNAGGLSSLEAMASGVPVISYRCLPGHGRANAAVLQEAGLSPWPQDAGDLAAALRQALDGDLRRRQRLAFARLGTAPDAAALITGLVVSTGAGAAGAGAAAAGAAAAGAAGAGAAGAGAAVSAGGAA